MYHYLNSSNKQKIVEFPDVSLSYYLNRNSIFNFHCETMNHQINCKAYSKIKYHSFKLIEIGYSWLQLGDL